MILDYSEYVTERGSNGIVNFVRADNGTELFKHNSVCPFCQKRITSKVYSKSSRDYPEWLFGSFDQSEQVVQCPICGWWEYKYSIKVTPLLMALELPILNIHQQS